MNNEFFFNEELPKWPGLLVVGQPITKEQAMEVLIRTDGLDFMCNDRDWDRALTKLVYAVDSLSWNLNDGLKEQLGIEGWNEQTQYTELRRSVVKPVELYYLRNERISSSWIGGPHGWCKWDGSIGCSNYNVGKWPGIEEIYNEWVLVAEAFPFLDLKSQLLDCEIGDDKTATAVVEFTIKDGKVSMSVPTKLIAEPKFDFGDRFTAQYPERGCTMEQFVEAFEYVKTKFTK